MRNTFNIMGHFRITVGLNIWLCVHSGTILMHSHGVPYKTLCVNSPYNAHIRDVTIAKWPQSPKAPVAKMWVAATLAAVMAVTACAAPTSIASPTPMGEEGLDQVQLRLLGLAYGRFVDFLKVLRRGFFLLTWFNVRKMRWRRGGQLLSVVIFVMPFVLTWIYCIWMNVSDKILSKGHFGDDGTAAKILEEIAVVVQNTSSKAEATESRRYVCRISCSSLRWSLFRFRITGYLLRLWIYKGEDSGHEEDPHNRGNDTLRCKWAYYLLSVNVIW